MEEVDQVPQQNNKSSLSSYVIEGGVILVLTVVILFTLNYFSLIPFSKIFPWLSFLPTSSRSISQRVAFNIPTPTPTSSLLRYIVTEKNPLMYKNPDPAYVSYYPVDGSTLQVPGKLKIHIKVEVLSSGIKGNVSTPSGMLIDNSLRSSSREYQYIKLFYFQPNNTWIVQYFMNGELSKGVPLLTLDKTSNYLGDFTFEISTNGKFLTIYTPTGKSKKVAFPQSFYNTSDIIRTVVQVAPHSEVDVLSLSYQY